MTKIGIVILNYKTYQETEILVDTLLGMYSPNLKLFIEIVDNCSPNNSYDYLKDKYDSHPQIEVSQSGENGGFAKGNDFGLKRLARFEPDYALILNNDVLFEVDVLEKCVKRYPELDKAGVIAPMQYLPNGKIAKFPRLKCNTFIDDLLLNFRIINKLLTPTHRYKSNTDYDNVQSVDIVPGCFLFVKYDLFQELGFFDETTFLYCEERFLFKKMNTAGRINYILLDCKYIHNHSTTIKKEISLNNQYKLLLDGRIAFTQKYRSNAGIKIRLLKLAFVFFRFESYIINIVRRYLS